MKEPVMELYNETLKAMEQAKVNGNFYKVTLAKSILAELVGSVNMNDSLGRKLFILYTDWYRQLKDSRNLDSVIKQLTELRDAWEAAYESASRNRR